MGTELDRVAVQSWEFNTDAQQDLIDAITDLRRDRPWVNTTALMVIIGGLVLIIIIIVIANKRKLARIQEEQEAQLIEETMEESEVRRRGNQSYGYRGNPTG